MGAAGLRLLLALLLSLGMFVDVNAEDMVLFVGTEAAGNQVVINKGGVVKLVLPGNAATGHRWEVIADGSPVLQADGEIGYVSEGVTGKDGGRFTAQFRGRQGGEARLRLVYRRPADKETVSQRTYELPVRVVSYYDMGEVFRRLDLSGDGCISRDEFFAARAVPMAVNERGNAFLAMNSMERNKDGEIDRAALRSTLFEIMNKNLDACIDLREVQETVGSGFALVAW